MHSHFVIIIIIVIINAVIIIVVIVIVLIITFIVRVAFTLGTFASSFPAAGLLRLWILALGECGDDDEEEDDDDGLDHLVVVDDWRKMII